MRQRSSSTRCRSSCCTPSSSPSCVGRRRSSVVGEERAARESTARREHKRGAGAACNCQRIASVLVYSTVALSRLGGVRASCPQRPTDSHLPPEISAEVREDDDESTLAVLLQRNLDRVPRMARREIDCLLLVSLPLNTLDTSTDRCST